MLSTWRHRSRFDAQRWPQRNRNQTKEAFIKQRQAVETPVVLRVPSLAADAMKRCQEGVDAVTFGAAVDSARRAGEKRDLLFAAAAPMRKLIEQDEKALASLRKLAGVRKSRLKGRVVSVLSQFGGMFPETSFNLTPGPARVRTAVRSRPTGAYRRFARQFGREPQHRRTVRQRAV